MRVLVLNPARSGQGTVPLNVPILIAALRGAGHEVKLFDFSDYLGLDTGTGEYESRYFKEAPLLAGMSLRKTDPVADFDATIRSFQPEVIAATALSVDFRYATEFLRPFRERYGIPVVFGGIHTILLPGEVLHTGVVDYIISGEGERALPDLLRELEKYKRGLTTKTTIHLMFKSPYSLTDISSLPPPDYSDFNPIHFWRTYNGTRYKMLNYELSRGCPFNCTYCVNGVLKKRYHGLGKYHRVKDADHSIRELVFLIAKHGFNFIRFWDEDFTSLTQAYLDDYADMYANIIGLPFIIYARVETVTRQKLALLKKMGCVGVAMGIESGNEQIRREVMNRHMNNEEIRIKFGMVRAAGIRATAYNMMGLPFETRDTIFDTINLNRKVNPDSFSCTLMTAQELQGLHRTFPMYVRFPKERWPEIRIAESNNAEYETLLAEFKAMYL